MREKVLSVEDLKISFKTINGNVQAVRNISFDLHKGETLAIVGESGSGKSVTSRSILGILANNAIVQNGRIIYDGKDLLKMSEEEFHKLRGDKISMIFQDPMSSLNPIMKVGKQITEAMILKNKSNRSESRKVFNTYLKTLKNYILLSNNTTKDGEEGKQLLEMVNNFDKYEIEHVKLYASYSEALESAMQAKELLDDLIFRVSKNAVKNIKVECDKLINTIKLSYNHFIVCEEDVLVHINNLKNSIKAKEDVTPILTLLNELFEKSIPTTTPNFFSLAYYTLAVSSDIPNVSIEELNTITHKHLDEEFMFKFIEVLKNTIKYNEEQIVKNSSDVVTYLTNLQTNIANELSHDELHKMFKESYDVVAKSINQLDTIKRNPAYTYKTSCEDYINKIINGEKKNLAEENRFNKQTAKNEKLIAKGKNIDWSIPPKNIWDLVALKDALVLTVSELITYLENYISSKQTSNLDSDTIAVIDYLNDLAMQVGIKVTKKIAKRKAIKIMEEVGIPDAPRRYKQYPFQFSGGMRQRVVIAIALSANPNVLICDEPTTALDVTIQSQILELINKLKKERNLSIIFITHDLGVVANMADRIAVMYAGKIVEIGSANDVFYNPRHPYTWALLSSMPDLETSEKLESIAGTPPNMIYPPVGDAFAARNKYAMQIDFEMQPPLFKVSDDHYAATWLLHKDAPVVNPPKIIVDRINRMKQKGDLNDEQ